MRTEFNANEMNIRVRRDADTGEETTATVSFMDENGNVVVGRLTAANLRASIARFTQDAMLEGARHIGPAVLAYQEAVANTTKQLEAHGSLLLSRVATALGTSTGTLARAAREARQAIEEGMDEEPEVPEPEPEVPDADLEGDVEAEAEAEAEVRRSENSEVLANL